MYIVYGWQCANILGVDRHLEYIDNKIAEFEKELEGNIDETEQAKILNTFYFQNTKQQIRFFTKMQLVHSKR